MFLELPESISLKLKPAGFGSRALAYFLDASIRWGTIFLFLLFGYLMLNPIFGFNFSFKEIELTSLNKWIYTILTLIFAAVEWFYATYFEVNHQGQTPGKKFFGLKVISKEGLEIDFQRSAIRNILLPIDLIPGLGLIGLISMLSSKNSQRLGDHAAGTLVIYTPKVQNKVIKNSENTESLIEIPKDLHQKILKYMKIRNELFKEAKHELELKLIEEIEKENINLNLESVILKHPEEKLDYIYSRIKPAKVLRE